MHPYGGRTGTSVEGNDQGSIGLAVAIGAAVVGVKERGDGFPFLVPNGLRAGRGAVVHLAAIDGARMLSHDHGIDRDATVLGQGRETEDTEK
ncbi:hypothetical protein [Reichenbachiella ulvae]|uniref:hypothetical protein n=1 Tax=Reichenbachiella ulvae TaxID=2980104 RepID=UPI004038D4E8